MNAFSNMKVADINKQMEGETMIYIVGAIGLIIGGCLGAGFMAIVSVGNYEKGYEDGRRYG